MKFDGTTHPDLLGEQRVVGRPVLRIDGPLKVTGAAKYAYEHQDMPASAAYGWVLGAQIPKGKVRHIDTSPASTMPGVLGFVSTLDHAEIPGGSWTKLPLFGGSEVHHYNQAILLVIAESFEQARDAAHAVRVTYRLDDSGVYELTADEDRSKPVPDTINVSEDAPLLDELGNFDHAFEAAPVRVDQVYYTPYQSHAMMEPHATVAAWEGKKLTVWTSNQMVNWARKDLPKALLLRDDDVRILSPFIGGGFGAKLGMHCDVVLAALGAKTIGRPVKVALQRPLIMNNTVHRPATIARIRLGADSDGRLNAISHISIFGNVKDGMPEPSTGQTRLLYAAANRQVGLRQVVHDLPEGSAMRAPGEATGLMALEIAMDELAEALGMDPIELRIVNDTSVVPQSPKVTFTGRHLAECLRHGADLFDWKRRSRPPGELRDGPWLIGIGMACGIRDHKPMASKARVRLESGPRLIVETDMTDIGTGSYTIIAQTAAEITGLSIEQVEVRLGDSSLPESSGSGGQWGAGNVTAGVFAACLKLRQQIAERLQASEPDLAFRDGKIVVEGREIGLDSILDDGDLVGEDGIEYAFPEPETVHPSTFVGQFAEVGVHAYTGEVRLRRMLAVCDAGRILNPVTARSQVLGAMTMGIGAALSEELAVDPALGYFVNHDLGGYEVAVHADVPRQEVVFLDYPDAAVSPVRAKGVGELGLCGAAPAIANAVYNATGIRVRSYPITVDKLIGDLPKLRAI